jgi:hypothetical protein
MYELVPPPTNSLNTHDGADQNDSVLGVLRFKLLCCLCLWCIMS